ncbi:histone-lysine N-methyltransferase ASHH2 isoform X2 [Cicer arietinum]|uniref:Histone-lysine N-methyltransferase ASHH2 isoform X2 n=1 Tax=Cicer arietinum TaxID=3827 RepID=A0A1S2YBW3_CICAR|nr:histone-lysine N-methyltransferase ASHH2 isoform X2 [Cicer arietinum]
MGSCGEPVIVGDPAQLEQPLCSGFPAQLVSVQESCSEEPCDVLDVSGMADGFLGEGEVGCSASYLDVMEGYGDALTNECENDDMSQLEKTAEDGCWNSLGICSEDIEVSGLKSGGLCLEGNFKDEGNLDLPLESITSNDLQKHWAEQGEQKNGKNIMVFSVGDDLTVVEGKNDGADLLAGAVNCVLDVEHSEVPLESDSWPKAVENCDALDGIEANSCRQISSSLNFEVPSGVLFIDAKVESTSDKLHDLKNGEDCDSTCDEKIRAFVDKEITVNSYVQASSSPDTKEESTSDELHDQKNGQDYKSSCEEKLRAFVDKESTVNSYLQASSLPDFHRTLRTSPVIDSQCQPTLMDPGGELKNGILQTEDNFCTLKDCSADGNANSTIRKQFYPESGQSSFVVLTNSFPKDAPDLLSKGDGASINNDCAVDNPGQTNNDGKEDVEVDHITENILLPSQRSQRTKFGSKTQTRKASRKSKNKASMTHRGGGMNMNLEAARKKRSCLCKPARSSVWGSLGNIEQFFQHENELEVSEAMCQNVVKARSKFQGGEMIKNATSSSSLSSVQKDNVPTSTTRFRLKIKFGKENALRCSNVLIPESVGGLASASYLESDPGSRKVASNSADKFSEALALSNLESFRNDLDKDFVVLNGQIVNSQLENSKITEKSDEDAVEPCHAGPPEKVVEALVKPINNSVIDPGTSPDSEVIDSIPDVQVGERHEDVHFSVLGSSKELNSHMDVTFRNRGKKKDKLIYSGNCITEDGSQGQPGNNRAKHSKNHRRKRTSSDVVSSLELPISTELSKSVKSKELSAESSPLSGDIVLGGPMESLKVKSHAIVKTAGKSSADHGFTELQGSKNLPSSTRPWGRKLPKSLEPRKVSKGKSKASDSTSRKKPTSRPKERQKEPINRSEVKGKDVSLKVTCEVEDHPHPDIVGNHKLAGVGKINTGDNRVPVSVSNLDVMPGFGLEEQQQSPRNAWVSCDDCHKWRRIPALLADQIDETNCTWTCKDSSDKAYADCAIPQEKSNAEINAELGLSDASGEEDAYGNSKTHKELEYQLPLVSQESTFTRIFTNEFLHRNPRTQTIDEVMVCHCKPPREGKMGCGDECLNRMLNIECVQGTCPCGDRCSNQQFQKRNYSRLKWFKCGKKGYGLKALERVAEGQFIIEYVGEVLDVHAYEARQREYALKGHRHFYFMTLNGSEVIDASAKGNLGRFINHSCDPNCRTEKWMVNGEICIGLFALRNIKQDEELTFDYNYVRVFGAAAKKCYCGSLHCQGYIGGADPNNGELIVQGESDDEFPEPMMLSENGEIDDSVLMPKCIDSVNTKSSRHLITDRDVLDKCTTAICADGSPEEDSSTNPASAVSLLHSSVEVEDSKSNLPSSDRIEEISQQIEDTTSKPMPADSKELPNSTDSNRESKSEMVEVGNDFSQSHLLVKTPRLNASVKKGKVRANAANALTAEVAAPRLPVSSIKNKKVEGSSNGRFEAVQGKLNELLDGNGGISKRKDATKGYLKLLLLTVASGDRSNGEAIQSNRDLSMILDALLKTKSRAVLNDIISKNGLQMLHKIMKQYRQDFKKIPILRKLLKVLEYLAAGKILTPEHINGGPPCHGMERFRDSMLSLTEHDDKQVHQIARSFRDRWIPRHGRKHGYMDRDDNRMESHRGFNSNRFSVSHSHRHEQGLRPKEATDCGQQPMLVATVDARAQEGCSTPSLDGVEINGAKKRKRKSRWDQPAETNSYSDAIISSINESQNVHEEVPPGFSCPIRSLNSALNSGTPALQNASHSGCPPSLVIGQPKEKFNSRLPVSYGLPWSVAQQYGTPHAEITGCWITAPGMPFNPFPPLPPYPRDNKDCQPSSMEIDQPAEVKQSDATGPVNCCSDDMIPSTTGANSEDTNLQCEDAKHDAKRLKGDDSDDLGKKYFRQQKWNNSKIHRTWFKRDAWKCNGNSSSGDICSIDVGDVSKESKVTSYSEEDEICREEKGGK